MLWMLMAAILLAATYGVTNLLAGVSQLRLRRIRPQSALLMILFGVVQVLAAMLMAFGKSVGPWLLVLGLAGMHWVAVRNGRQLYGRVNPSHHLVRGVFSLVIAFLSIWSVR